MALLCAGTVVCIPDQPPSALMQPSGLLYKSFPALVLSEYSERSLGGKRRKTAVNRQKRPSVGRRRAISELMVSWASAPLPCFWREPGNRRPHTTVGVCYWQTCDAGCSMLLTARQPGCCWRLV